MGKVATFEEIIAWQKARVFNKHLYLKTNAEKFKKDVDLVRQIRRASVSISSNIAEGFERHTDKEFIQYLHFAKASAGEVRSQLYLAIDLEYISQDIFDNLYNEIMEISRLISGFIKYLQNKIR
jgi:four helix bundle protein